MALVKKNDGLDRLVLFLAKRDGIDKLVKTFQYVFKLAHWRLQETHPDLAARASLFSGQCGLSRKAFRTGRFLTGFNALRHTRQPNWLMTILALLGNSGDMVYFFFDHFTWMSRAGLLNPHLAVRFCHVSASGEAVAYVAFVTLELILIEAGRKEEKKLKEKVAHHMEFLEQGGMKQIAGNKLLPSSKPQLTSSNTDVPNKASDQQDTSNLGSISGSEIGNTKNQKTESQLSSCNESMEVDGDKTLATCDSGRWEEIERIREEVKQLQEKIRAIQAQRLFQVMGIAANVADLIIAIADIEPNPFCCHPVTLGVSGLVSAWAGWYRNWPS